MMKGVLLLLLLVWGSASRAAPPTPAEKVIDQLLGQGSVYCDLAVIPPAQKEAVIARLQETARLKGGYSLLGTTVLDATDADLLLLRLGDTLTIERMIKDYRAYDSMTSWGYVETAFERSRQPKIIPYLAEDFYADEDPAQGITVNPPPGSTEFAVGVPARSIFSGVAVTRIIEKSPAFGPKVKAWARQAFALRLQSPGRFRGLMRTWWEVNKAAFAREDYLAVTPVAEQDAVATTPRPATPRPEKTAATFAPPILPTTPEPPNPAPMVEPRARRWPWLAGIVAVLLVVIAVGLKRCTQPPRR